jgi:hypothetical protein
LERISDDLLPDFWPGITRACSIGQELLYRTEKQVPSSVWSIEMHEMSYRGNTQQSLIGRGTDSEDPGRFNPGSCGAYRLNDGEPILLLHGARVPGLAWDHRKQPSFALPLNARH